ncbi:MAG TPA: hypothetical protein ENI92_07985 [Bacteroidetes bacterium]|nr:hypothetical protein [Bacteroidota bacterium]
MSKRRWYQIAGITIQVEADVPITETTFHHKFDLFRVEGPGDDTFILHHHFTPPEIDFSSLPEAVYEEPPWIIYRDGPKSIYVNLRPDGRPAPEKQVVVHSANENRADIYSGSGQEKAFRRGGMESLSLLPTDQVLIASLLPSRQACYLHSSAMILDESGLLFVGHSGAGKSTIAKLLRGRARLLCDDRNIVRFWPDGVKVHGTWHHGELPEVSSATAPLKAILFLEQDERHALVPVCEPNEAFRRLLPRLIRSYASREWWEKSLEILARIAREVPCHELRFAHDTGVVDLLEKL